MSGSLSIRLKGRVARKSSDFYPIHDLRLYSPERLPKYIDPERTKSNRILFALGSLPKTKEEVAGWLRTLEEENKSLFKELKARGIIPKNQGYKIARPLVAGILTLSHEAQKKLREEKLLDNFLEHAKEYLQTLAKALGTDLLYAVVHLDETAPHVHFGLRNISYKDIDTEAVKRLGWEDLLPNLRKAKGKAISNLFYAETGLNSINPPRDYQIPLERLQDSLEFFRPRIGFGRGIRKKERMARGEPYWKVIYRSVKRLHEDLPKEIKLAEEELRRLHEQIEEMKRKHDEMVEEIRKLEEVKAKLLQEIDAVERRWEKATAKVNELEKEKVILEREVLITQMKIKIFEHDLQITEERLKELNEEIRKYETMIQNRKREYERLQDAEKRLSEEVSKKQSVLNELEARLSEARKKREELSKEVERLQKVKDELERQTKAKEKELLELSEQLREAQKLAEKVKENELKLLVELQKALEENERLKEENLRLKNRIAKLETENEELKRELYGRDYGLGR